MGKAITIIWRILFGTLEFLVAASSIYQCILMIGMSVPVAGETLGNDTRSIYVISNGVHTDICLATADYQNWENLIDLNDYPQFRETPSHVCFGWGDKGFYLDTPEWSDLKLSTAVNAMLLNSPTAMHVSLLSGAPLPGPNAKRVTIRQENLALLINHIESSFLRDDGSALLIKGKSYWHNDNFYEAKGNYHLLQTCNSWTNDALKIAGARTSWKALTQQGIMRHLH